MEEKAKFWRIGEFEFNTHTYSLQRGEHKQRLKQNEGRLLAFLVHNFSDDPEYTNEQIIRAVWKGTNVSAASLHQSIRRLTKAFGGKKGDYIAARPYRLSRKPQERPDSGKPEEIRSSLWVPLHAPSLSPDPTTSAEAPKPDGLWFDPNSKTLWHMAKSVFLPLHGDDLDLKTGRLGALRRIEIPQAALTEALKDRPDLLMGRQVYEFLRDVWSHPKKYHSIIAGRPALRSWVETIWAPPPPGSKGLERRQLKNFYRAMQSPDVPVELLPDFTYAEVSCWRIFMQVFPESIGLLEMASSITKMRHTQRMALASLSSTLAMTEDWRTSSRAAAVARRLNREVAVSTVYSYRDYQVARHFLYAAVEAGESPVEHFLNFVHNPHHPVKWELDLNREYYKDRSDATMALTVVRKIGRPLNRDEWTRKITEYHRDLLPKNLIDEALQRMRQPGVPHRQ